MSTSNQTATSSGTPLPSSILERAREESKSQLPQIFELTYKFRGQTQRLCFSAPNLKGGISLGENYCRVYGYRFLQVSLFVHDLLELIERRIDLDFENINQSGSNLQVRENSHL